MPLTFHLSGSWWWQTFYTQVAVRTPPTRGAQGAQVVGMSLYSGAGTFCSAPGPEPVDSSVRGYEQKGRVGYVPASPSGRSGPLLGSGGRWLRKSEASSPNFFLCVWLGSSWGRGRFPGWRRVWPTSSSCFLFSFFSVLFLTWPPHSLLTLSLWVSHFPSLFFLLSFPLLPPLASSLCLDLRWASGPRRVSRSSRQGRPTLVVRRDRAPSTRSEALLEWLPLTS